MAIKAFSEIKESNMVSKIRVKLISDKRIEFFFREETGRCIRRVE